MQRRLFLLLGLLLATPALSRANSITVQGAPWGIVDLVPNTPGQVITLLISGTDPYSSTDLFMQINGGVGPAPFITHVFGDTGGLIADPALIAGSVWAGGLAGITSDPNGTSPTSSGLITGAGFATGGFLPTTANGIYVQFTISTVGVPGGMYPLTFFGSTMTLADPEGGGEDTPVPLQFGQMVLGRFIPEPSSYVLAAIGVIALFAVRRRKALA